MFKFFWEKKKYVLLEIFWWNDYVVNYVTYIYQSELYTFIGWGIYKD